MFTIGMTHGVLFLSYFVLSLFASHTQGWSVIRWLMVVLASIIPFAFIPMEMFLQKELRKNAQSA